MLVSVPLLLAAGDRHYYQAALPFWATVLLLPGLYLRVIGEMQADKALPG